MKTRILIRKDGAVFCWTPTLAATQAFKDGFIEDGKICGQDTPGVEPDRRAPVVAPATPAPAPATPVVSGPLTPEQLDVMTKRQCLAYAQERFQADLGNPQRMKVEEMRGKLWALHVEREERNQPVKKEIVTNG